MLPFLAILLLNQMKNLTSKCVSKLFGGDILFGTKKNFTAVIGTIKTLFVLHICISKRFLRQLYVSMRGRCSVFVSLNVRVLFSICVS